MTQYNSVNVNLSKLKYDRSKLAAQNAEKILGLSSNMIANATDKTSFRHILLPLDTQVSKRRETLAYNASVNIYLSKTQTSKSIQLGGFLS